MPLIKDFSSDITFTSWYKRVVIKSQICEQNQHLETVLGDLNLSRVHVWENFRPWKKYHNSNLKNSDIVLVAQTSWVTLSDWVPAILTQCSKKLVFLAINKFLVFPETPGIEFPDDWDQSIYTLVRHCAGNSRILDHRYQRNDRGNKANFVIPDHRFLIYAD